MGERQILHAGKFQKICVATMPSRMWSRTSTPHEGLPILISFLRGQSGKGEKRLTLQRGNLTTTTSAR